MLQKKYIKSIDEGGTYTVLEYLPAVLVFQFTNKKKFKMHETWKGFLLGSC